jgi:hypothetical protein
VLRKLAGGFQGQGPERDFRDTIFAPQLAQHGVDLAARAQVFVAERRQHEERRRCLEAQEKVQPIHRLVVAFLQVVERQQQRR